MQSLTIDILNSKALKLLQDLEQLHLIRLHNAPIEQGVTFNWAAKYKGAMTKQSLSDIDKQLNELRSEWD